MTRAQRRMVGILVGVVGAVLLAASAAYACGVLATLQLDRDRAAVGETISAHGTGFRDGEPNVVSDVVITLDSRDGQELWRGRATADRTVDAVFALTDVAPGRHIVFATQYFADGSPVAGTPARTTIEVTAQGAVAVGAPTDGRSAHHPVATAPAAGTHAIATAGGAATRPFDVDPAVVAGLMAVVMLAVVVRATGLPPRGSMGDRHRLPAPG